MDLLAQGTERLAAEMALVLGIEVSDMEKQIENTVAAAIASETAAESLPSSLPSQAN
jgi:hypothetical protein